MYIPEVGELNSEELAVYRWCKQYDERLVFMKDRGQYTIFVKTDMSDGMPRLKAVHGFGFTCPSVDTVAKTVYESDTWIHGEKVLRDMDARKAAHDKHNRMIREAARDEAAERIAHELRKDGIGASAPVFFKGGE